MFFERVVREDALLAGALPMIRIAVIGAGPSGLATVIALMRRFHHPFEAWMIDAGDAPVLKEKIALTEGIEGDWAPGGSEVIGYSAPTGVLFLLMHSGATEGSHKDGAEEIWAYDLAKKELLYRSVAHGEDSIAVTQTPVPVVYGVVSEEGALHRYEVDPTARFAAKHAGEAESLGTFLALVLAGE